MSSVDVNSKGLIDCGRKLTSYVYALTLAPDISSTLQNASASNPQECFTYVFSPVLPTINPATLAHFYMLNKTEISYYGGKSKIIPLDLDIFMKLIELSYIYSGCPSSNQVQILLEKISDNAQTSQNESERFESIYNCVNQWLIFFSNNYVLQYASYHY